MDSCRKENLLIVGMGQYGFLAREIAWAMNCFDRIDFLDDNHPDAVGKMEDLARLSEQYDCAVVAIGNPEIRKSCMEKLDDLYQLVSLIHPMSYISPSACVGRGCIIEPLAVIHTQTLIADGCLISAGAVINHNSKLGVCCHIDCNGTVPARAELAAYTKVSAGQVYGNSDQQE